MTIWLFDRSTQQGRLRLTDRDRLKLLHNMSTNDFNQVQVGQGRVTTLTTALARTIDRVVVYQRAEDALMLTHYPTIVRPWLQRHIFFNDKVGLQDISAAWGQLEIYGATAADVVSSLTPQATPSLAPLPRHHFVEVPYLSDTVMIARTYPLLEDGFTVLAPSTIIPILISELSKQATLGSLMDYDRLRIIAGLAGPHTELTEEYIPLELGAWDAVSFRKGCYIGQEIIARMESRQKLAKALVRLDLAKAVQVPAPLYNQVGQAIGTLTSLVPMDTGAVGLGFVRTEALSEHVFHVGTADGISAQLATAPLLQAGFTS